MRCAGVENLVSEGESFGINWQERRGLYFMIPPLRRLAETRTRRIFKALDGGTRSLFFFWFFFFLYKTPVRGWWVCELTTRQARPGKSVTRLYVFLYRILLRTKVWERRLLDIVLIPSQRVRNRRVALWFHSYYVSIVLIHTIVSLTFICCFCFLLEKGTQYRW